MKNEKILTSLTPFYFCSSNQFIQYKTIFVALAGYFLRTTNDDLFQFIQFI